MSNLESASYTLEISNGTYLIVKSLNIKHGETVFLNKFNGLIKQLFINCFCCLSKNILILIG